MEKKSILLATLFLLAGCPGSGDRMVPRTATTVVINNNAVCALSIMKPGEKMTGAVIYSKDHDPIFTRFYHHPLYIEEGACLPLFDATFNAGTRYSITWEVSSAEKGLHLITADFTLAAGAQGNISLAQ
ncbi:putative T6SS immunity periplasmic lipoprotein [Kosakonia sp. WA-90]|uniref:putative T6SS immunity periplasmic lipoprotein n=1 Tax=Kosakonia sp. WA-90 TaxID=3153576 RepID=UPI00325D3EC8